MARGKRKIDFISEKNKKRVGKKKYAKLPLEKVGFDLNNTHKKRPRKPGAFLM